MFLFPDFSLSHNLPRWSSRAGDITGSKALSTVTSMTWVLNSTHLTTTLVCTSTTKW